MKTTIRVLFLLVLISSLQSIASAQNDTISKRYSFIVQDTPSQLFTMRQFNESYLSGYRMLSKELDEKINPRWSALVQFGINSLFLMPLTHEEGHRSILTSKGIGSISQPYFNSKGAAYVNGVTDAELLNLRNSDLPTYIRLHTAGLESDYMLTRRVETILAYGFDDYNSCYIEYFTRKLSHISYYAMSVFPVFEPNLKEESNELDRDIVGHDVYGAVRHIHRPNMSFYRYTRYNDLTTTEKNYIGKVAALSLLNLVHPAIVKKPNFKIGDNSAISAGMGFNMAPFGSFIDENIWFRYGTSIYSHLYVREYFNSAGVFMAGGISLADLKVSRWMMISVDLHGWQQPARLSFVESAAELGGALNCTAKMLFRFKNPGHFSAFSLDIGGIIKTAGYLPEELNMDRSAGFRLGFSMYTGTI